MIASLRGRLVAGVLALAAVGMLLVGGITYTTQRSFQLDRVDQQLASAVPALQHEFMERNGGSSKNPYRGGRRGAPPPGGGAPSDTFGQLRNASGTVVDSEFLGPDDSGESPELPADIALGDATTVETPQGDYRVLAQRFGDNAVTVAAIPLSATNQALDRLLLVLSLVIGGVLALVGAFAWVVVRIGLLPLDRMGHTAAAIAGGDLSHRVEMTDPRTEVGRLGTALNRMLDRLEDAFAAREASQERLRRFIADASHELRTPLVSIRGYAELYRMGAARSDEDVAKAMRRIEDESARMGVLVEDLLTLARLDEVRPAPHVPVDLAVLASDAVDDARVTAPDRTITLEADHGWVTGDADQLRQVFANLLRNALVHTPSGTPIEVSVERHEETVALEVRDHGRGLPGQDPGALFERFWRAEAGRERGKGGAGLGLAIVAGIVDAHGGTVSAANAPGGGAAFQVRLPAR
ncbi:HAMP domain-containing histidine kinase [Solirubrobacter phytolaccae]|uniref:histidine kinase n=1 Tax=Solirubrobacter phytolaccae TaxID=1404360 RepID=A0A9X3NC72_9ACTN|nr:HAMP domain-containing sensor histidine kinase [Solirubrobacter phytolaccae]MDA0184000.1 HAMP domain-containing histidine kinase [Solirubrobacter phytolaccae]